MKVHGRPEPVVEAETKGRGGLTSPVFGLCYLFRVESLSSSGDTVASDAGNDKGGKVPAGAVRSGWPVVVLVGALVAIALT